MKYNIEGGLNFFEELYKSLDDEDDSNVEDKNVCLITNKPLCDKFVEMTCGHKFNYIPLYLDIKNHKQKFNGMEGSSSRLAINEIRCPYCRKKQLGVLPYYQDLGLEQVLGVNWFDNKYCNSISSSSSYYKKCEFLMANPTFDPSNNNVVETSEYNNGNCKFLKCYNLGSQLGYQHGTVEGENYGDTKFYCWIHKKQMIKQYKKAITDKAKEEVKNAKLLAKEEAKKKEMEEKQKVKEEKQKAKEEAKKKTKEESNKKAKNKPEFMSENVVLGPVNLEQGCIEILKNGTNKGNTCGCKLYQDNMCKRHYSIKNKIIVINLIENN